MIAARQLGSLAATRAPSRSRCQTPSELGARGCDGTLTNDRAITTAPNETPLTRNAIDGDQVTRITPATAGPSTRPMFHWAEDNETAAIRSSCSTRSGSSAWYAGKPIEPADEPTKLRTTRSHGDRWPPATRAARRKAKAASATVVAISQRRRSRRSASIPPSGASRPIGRKPAAMTKAVQNGLCWSRVTKVPRATVCTQLPTFETRAEDQTSA